MTNELKDIIQQVKIKLNEEPAGIIIGKLEDAISNANINNNVDLTEYDQFLKECNGARCGSIDFWSLEELSKNQYRVTEMTGGKDKWICIGQILYEPIAINKEDRKVYRFYQGCETEIPADCFGNFDEFLMEYVFGRKYAEIIPDYDKEEWYQFLKKINLI